MILKDGTKHACRSCITGHRSSKCVHHDRELFPIAKKGRPSTQCKACKQRGSAHAGQCECQNKRKTKSQGAVVASASGSGSGGYAEGSTSRKDSGNSQFSSVPASEHGMYPHALAYHTGGIDGSSTHATNSSASSPSYAQHSFALHQSTDNHLLPGGLPFPQPDQHFAYGNASGHSEHHLELPPPRNMAAGVVRSRPGTSAEEETPWWLYRAGYSPHAGHPYEPPPPSAHTLDGHHHQTNTPGIYSDYAQYMAQPSPLVLGTPGNSASNPAAFVWHNNATSYRDYMASQQHSNYHAPSSAHPSNQPLRMHEHHHTAPPPSLHHHHSVPHTNTSAPSVSMDSAPLSAPLPLSSQAHLHQQQRDNNDHHWHTAVSEPLSYDVPSVNDRRNDIGKSSEDAYSTRMDSHSERLPALNYDSGSSRMPSTESVTSIKHLPTPVSLGPMSGSTASGGQQRYDSKEYSQSFHPSGNASLRERRSTSFDQIVLSRGSPINLKLPEDRKKRKFEYET